MRIIATHLFNDFSGSPKVLMQLLKTFTKNNIETHLFTSNEKNGFLSDIPNVKNHFFNYTFSDNKLLRLCFFSYSQVVLFIKLLFFIKKTDVIYCNTVLPFGAAMAGKLRGCRVIYHIHETSMKPQLLKNFLFGIVKLTAKEIIYVSDFLANKEPLNIKKHILYNVLEQEFIENAIQKRTIKKEKKIVLMLCSLKKYKGVDDFIALAKLLPEYQFNLIVNASLSDINSYFNSQTIPENCTVFETQKNTQRFYEEASIILNLSDVHLWVETFGLTILEAMAYGLPAIVPPIGGVVELVDDEENGYLINSKNRYEIANKIKLLLNDDVTYETMYKKAIQKSNQFSPDYFEKSILNCIFQKKS
jgi:glycosyltransferase involved in cell wall biosynthesis